MARSVENSARSDSSGILPQHRQRDSDASWLAATGLIGTGGGFVLPKLDGTPTEYGIAEEDNRAIRLAQRLTALDIADPHDWEKVDRSASRYILATLKRWIAIHGSDVIQKQFALNASISSSPSAYADDEHDSHLLYLTVNPDSAAYIVIGHTLERLAAIDFRLPASFYRLIVDSLRRWIRVYDYDDAQDRLEMLQGWVEGEEDPDQYEFPDVEGCIPAWMKEEPLEGDVMRELAQEIQDEQVAAILTAAFDLQTVSHKHSRTEISEEVREAFMDSNPPLPALLISFKRHDAIAGCFDEDSQGMLEAEPEPNLIAEIEPGDVASVRQAFDLLGSLCETLAAVSRLATLLPGNDEEA